MRGLPKQSMRHCSRRCKGLGALDGAKRQCQTVKETARKMRRLGTAGLVLQQGLSRSSTRPRQAVRWRERPSKAVHEALLKALEPVSGGTAGCAAEDYKRLKLPKGSFGAS